ncbi:hypothetical protein [Paeniglutamicibacter cryotolerans]|uniref:IS1380 family transposase n=1 Tax=Paeniglutamicibacter cryotolerans TaxID=670079 RepID=A0A839QL08_9MICC|nr:hypothetical protein [Paeniglutamicibacter cryotolerans]MBB2997098.1 hypothetical protein [Paeniglutamicibacter cryotolerans]
MVASAGLLPVMTLARDTGLQDPVDQWVKIPTDKGANAGIKISSLVAGMIAGADSIDDMALLRHGAMNKVFKAICAPSTLGSFLRSCVPAFLHLRPCQTAGSALVPFLGAPAEDQ